MECPPGNPVEGAAGELRGAVSRWSGNQGRQFPATVPFLLQITPNITYGELTLQSEARRFTAQHQCNTAMLLCQFAQKARDRFNRPVIITSGYRPSKINAQVGGSTRSEHLYDAPDTGAIDFTWMVCRSRSCRAGPIAHGPIRSAMAHRKDSSTSVSALAGHGYAGTTDLGAP